MAKEESSSFWALKTVSAEDLSYKGNDGYKDDIQNKYVFDDSVQNHRQVKSGDIAVIINKKEVLAIAKISRIIISNGKKVRRKCPVCKTTSYDERKRQLPKYRCENGHTTDKLLSETIDVIVFEAYYSENFQFSKNVILNEKLKPYYLKRYNPNMSMQRLKSEFFETFFPNETIKLLEAINYPSAEDSGKFLSDLVDNYDPNSNDERTKIFRAIMQRRGQQTFREKLREAYGNRCMITGCEILDVIEAAHINPYKGEKDNHISNGLLLRADIHTLFDLDLIGIDPIKLIIHLNNSMLKSEYGKFLGKKLQCTSKKAQPNKIALKKRWELFLNSNAI